MGMHIRIYFMCIFCICQISVNFVQTIESENPCISEWQRQGLERRFSLDQIRWMCKQKINHQQILRSAPMRDAPQMTQRQLAYIDFVQNCRNNECRLKFPSDAEEANTMADPSADPRCKWRKKSWRPKFCDITKHPACKKGAQAPNFCQPQNTPGFNGQNRGKRSLIEQWANYQFYSEEKTWLNLKQMDLRDRTKRQSGNGPAVRREYRMLTDSQRDAVHFAMNALKKETVDQTNKWDLFTSFHYPQQAPGAHWGPAFLPWHREFLRQFEVALRSESPEFPGIPYWDSTLDYHLPDPRDSVLWTASFMGNGDGFVREGPFNNWPTLTPLENQPNVNNLYRGVGTSPFGGLIREDDLNWMLNRTNFGQFSACVDPTFELLHGLPHIFVGGFMQIIRISPNDPIFYLHHTYIDYLWEQFRQQRQTVQQRLNDWAPADKLCDDAHKIEANMSPFPGLKNRDGLSEEYTRRWYRFDDPPTCRSSNQDCGSPYLWCDLREFRCKSKIRSNGNCSGLEGTNVCWRSGCSRGVCNGGLDGTPQPNLVPTRPPDFTSIDIITESPMTVPPVTIPPVTMPPITLPPQTLPPGSYNTKVSQAPPTYPTVVFKTFLIDENGAVTDGVIQVEGVNYQGVTTSSPVSQPKYPEYPGIVYAQIKDPTLSYVQAKVSAFDGAGRPCRAYCAQGYYKNAYVPCAGQITLSSQADYSNPIPYTAKPEVKRFLNADMSQKPDSWKVRAPYISFLCGSETNTKRFQEMADAAKPPVTDSDHIWFHVLVLDGRVPYHRGLPGSTVQSKTIDYRGETYEAEVPKDSVFPHYFGVAPVRAANSNNSPTVKVDVKAFDPAGKSCIPTCPMDKTSKTYARCSGMVTLSRDPTVSDLFSFSSDDDLKDFLNWDMTSHPNDWRRMVSNLQFVC